jgi:hypothetical protein
MNSLSRPDAVITALTARSVLLSGIGLPLRPRIFVPILPPVSRSSENEAISETPDHALLFHPHPGRMLKTAPNIG